MSPIRIPRGHWNLAGVGTFDGDDPPGQTTFRKYNDAGRLLAVAILRPDGPVDAPNVYRTWSETYAALCGIAPGGSMQPKIEESEEEANLREVRRRVVDVRLALEGCRQELERLEMIAHLDADDVNALSMAKGYAERAGLALTRRFGS